MYVCMYVYIYIYIHIHTYIYTCVRLRGRPGKLFGAVFLTLVSQPADSDVCSCCLKPFLTADRKEAKASFPIPLPGPCRLEGTTLANRLAANRHRKHFLYGSREFREPGVL